MRGGQALILYKKILILYRGWVGIILTLVGREADYRPIDCNGDNFCVKSNQKVIDTPKEPAQRAASSQGVEQPNICIG